MMSTEQHPITPPLELVQQMTPDYAFIYAKVARHVAAAAAAMRGGQLNLTRDELNEAMEAIAIFETTAVTITADRARRAQGPPAEGEGEK